MRNGDAAADPRRSQIFPLEQIRCDPVDGQAETGRALAANSSSSNRLFEARTSIRTSVGDSRSELFIVTPNGARTKFRYCTGIGSEGALPIAM